ncbi:hypothetical protein F5Y01DRAFT_299978 [Xylaria sp. FL0043]|nr:hypothetical protein F5Y01DRAFT_299978 [Xylaria sp. FL0043]
MQIAKATSTLVLAGSALAVATSPQPSVVCTTNYGTVPQLRHVPTNTRTQKKTVTLTLTSTRTPIVTVRASPVTATVSTTSTVTETTTGAVDTDIATITVTSTAVVTETDTETDTATSTSSVTTVVTITSTVPAPAGFTPVAQQAGYVPKNKRTEGGIVKRTGLQPLQAAKKVFPECVECARSVISTAIKTSTVTGRPRTTTLPATSTATTTSVVSQTTTSTVFPPHVTSTVTSSVSTTSTTTTTSTATTTTTVTTTVTNSVAAPTPYYAACGPDNIVSSANGNSAVDEFFYGLPGYQSSCTPDAYSCCVACFTSTVPCFATLWFYGECDMITSTTATCAAGVPYGGSFQTDPSDRSSDGFVVSNGPCGTLQDAGNY